MQPTSFVRRRLEDILTYKDILVNSLHRLATGGRFLDAVCVGR
jgi:hypothetical protein